MPVCKGCQHIQEARDRAHVARLLQGRSLPSPQPLPSVLRPTVTAEGARLDGTPEAPRAFDAPPALEWPAHPGASGYAFESVCIKHVTELKRAIGVEAVETTESSWRHAGGAEAGAQIDLVIDRKDGCINLCEMKFSEGEFTIDKGYGRELANKVAAFARATGTRKALFLTMVTVAGVRDNAHKQEHVQTEKNPNHPIVIKKIETNKQLADIITKGLVCSSTRQADGNPNPNPNDISFWKFLII